MTLTAVTATSATATTILSRSRYFMRWDHPTPDLDTARALADACCIPLAIAQLLCQRGIHSAEAAKRFLTPSLDQLHPPEEMLGMEAALARLTRAITARERILIYGDYDVDGTTAVVILKTVIEILGGQAEFHVPHRIREGYGMRDEVIERAAADGVTLVISVDTGIRAFHAAETAQRLHLDLIVTDHHLPEAAEGVPSALAVLNPNQKGCGYPCKSLCGAGVAFKMAQALLTRAGKERLIPSFLKMVAIATIADSVPLCGENRVIAKLGLDGLRRPVNGGLRALLHVAQLTNLEPGRQVSSTDIAFRVAPRINAAGRMDIAQDVIELFTTQDSARMIDLANKLDKLNSERQQEEAKIIDCIVKRLEEDASFTDQYCLLIDGEGWHRGVIGIAATRIVERTGKPVLIVSRDSETDEAHGSGRSIAGFHLLGALESEDCRKLFRRFGGHAAAVGFAMDSAHIPQLRQSLHEYARTKLTAEDFVPSLKVDAEITLDEITPAFHRSLRMLEPFGIGNPEPVFAARDLRLIQPPRLLKEKHLKLRLARADNASGPLRPFDALGWRMAERLKETPLVVGDHLDVAFTIDENLHPDFGGLQLVMKDFRRTQSVASGT